MSDAEYRYRIQRFLTEYKTGRPCHDCGEFFPSYCLDFDHRDATTKVKKLSRLAQYSMRKVLEEIGKCDLVCATCHRIRTFARAPLRHMAVKNNVSSRVSSDLLDLKKTPFDSGFPVLCGNAPGHHNTRSLFVNAPHSSRISDTYGILPFHRSPLYPESVRVDRSRIESSVLSQQGRLLTMKLSLFAIQKAKPRDKMYRLADGHGLALQIETNGSRLWRFRYRFAGKANMLTFGPFPEVSLAAAREKRNEARGLIAEGIDPAKQRQEQKAAAVTAAGNTFGLVVADYLKMLEEKGNSAATLSKNRWLLEDLAKPLAHRPITEVKPAELLVLLQRIEKTGRRDTARRLRGTIGSVYRFAIARQKAETDPTYALRGALLAPEVTHRPAITDERKLGALMSSIDEYDGWPTLRGALLFLGLTMTRPGEVRLMKRSEVIFPRATWRIPAERMKMRREFDVPLSTQALAVLRSVWELTDGELVFPSIRSARKPLSENAMNSALRRMGYAQHEMTAHGFRASASSILHERGHEHAVIESCLAHEEEDEVSRAYNRARYWTQRVQLMQQWADYLDQFRAESTASRGVA